MSQEKLIAGYPATPCSALSDALALIAIGPQRSAVAQEWFNAAGVMCPHCRGTEDVNEAAARIVTEWATKAVAALRGAEVLALCLADAKATLADSDQYGILTTEESSAIKARFLGNNDNVLAITDCLIEWPNAHLLPPAAKDQDHE